MLFPATRSSNLIRKIRLHARCRLQDSTRVKGSGYERIQRTRGGIFSISLKTRANGFLPTLIFALYDTLISLNPNEHKKKQCLSREQINSMTFY